LALVALAGSAEADDDGRQAAGLLRPPSESRIAPRQEDEMAEVHAVHAQRPVVFHEQELTGPRALQADPVADG